MPDLPPNKRKRLESEAATFPVVSPDAGPTPAYAELCCRTNFSFLEGASHPDELAHRAAELGYTALAITDINSLAGVVRAHAAAKQLGQKLLIGAEVVPEDAPPVILWARDRVGYARLSTLLTVGRRRARKGSCRILLDDIAGHSDGLLAGVPLAGLLDSDMSAVIQDLIRYRDVFGDRLSALASLEFGPDDASDLERMRRTAAQVRVPLAATNRVLFHTPDRKPLFDVLTAVRIGMPVSDLGFQLLPNAERHLKSPDEMQHLFAACPEAIERTVEIAGRCTFSLDELRYEYPHELCPAGMTTIEHLTRLTWQGAADRYPEGVPDKVRPLIEHELRLIEQLKYEAFFLTVQDLVTFARSRGILCQGRGSAANSAVCYCLGVTSVDPEKIDVLFERFVSPERNEPPDIDVDFEHERREEVLQYVYDKYGRDRAAMTATVITYRARSAIRDVGKALGLSLDLVDRLSKHLDPHAPSETIAPRIREAGLDPTTRLGRQFLPLVRDLLGFPRHLSQHTGGMVITHNPIHELVPVGNASMPGRTVIEWDKDDLDEMGLLKVDCLALGMLSAIRKCFELVERHHGKPLTLATVPAEDPAVYEMVSRADTVGVFQIESRAQMSMLPRLKPAKFYDLVIEVAIVRPGPIQGDMVHPYLRRRRGEEPVMFPDERIRGVLEKTLGVPLFQEQAMRLAVVAAGFTPGEADQLRRAMAAWRKKGVLDKFRAKLIDGMTANGYDAEFADRVFRQIKGFGEYGFPESHAASFALLVYVSSWLKCHHPAAFTAALLNSQPMGFYAPAQLVGDAKAHGVAIHPIDVNRSEWDCTLEASEGGSALRLGLRMVRGLAESDAERLVIARGDEDFTSLDDMRSRTGLGRGALVRLARADAFGSLRRSRRDALWDALPGTEVAPLFSGGQPDDEPVALPGLSLRDEVVADYRTQGLSLRAHPLTFLRGEIDRLKAVPTGRLADLPDGKWVRVAGLVLLRQRPGSAKGITFVTIEDETGQANLVIRPEVWERYRTAARTATVLLVTGELQKAEGVIHVVAKRLEDLSLPLKAVPLPSRDFQ
jgi:error-prone DNA polymerase